MERLIDVDFTRAKIKAVARSPGKSKQILDPIKLLPKPRGEKSPHQKRQKQAIEKQLRAFLEDKQMRRYCAKMTAGLEVSDQYPRRLSPVQQIRNKILIENECAVTRTATSGLIQRESRMPAKLFSSKVEESDMPASTSVRSTSPDAQQAALRARSKLESPQRSRQAEQPFEIRVLTAADLMRGRQQLSWNKK